MIRSGVQNGKVKELGVQACKFEFLTSTAMTIFGRLELGVMMEVR